MPLSGILELLGNICFLGLLILIVLNFMSELQLLPEKWQNTMMAIAMAIMAWLFALPHLKQFYVAAFTFVAAIGKFLGEVGLILAGNRWLHRRLSRTPARLGLLALFLFMLAAEFVDDLIVLLLGSVAGWTIFVRGLDLLLIAAGVVGGMREPVLAVIPDIVSTVHLRKPMFVAILLCAVFLVPMVFPQVKLLLKAVAAAGLLFGFLLLHKQVPK